MLPSWNKDIIIIIIKNKNTGQSDFSPCISDTVISHLVYWTQWFLTLYTGHSDFSPCILDTVISRLVYWTQCFLTLYTGHSDFSPCILETVISHLVYRTQRFLTLYTGDSDFSPCILETVSFVPLQNAPCPLTAVNISPSIGAFTTPITGWPQNMQR